MELNEFIKSMTAFRNTSPNTSFNISDEVSKGWYSALFSELYDTIKETPPEKRDFLHPWTRVCDKYSRVVARDVVNDIYFNTNVKKISEKELMKGRTKEWFILLEKMCGANYAKKLIPSKEDDDEKMQFAEDVRSTVNKFRGNAGEIPIAWFSYNHLFSNYYGDYTPYTDTYHPDVDAFGTTKGGHKVAIQIKNYSYIKKVSPDVFGKVWNHFTKMPEFGCENLTIREIKQDIHGIVMSIGSKGYFGDDTQKNLEKDYGKSILLIDCDEINGILTPDTQHKVELFEGLANAFE